MKNLIGCLLAIGTFMATVAAAANPACTVSNKSYSTIQAAVAAASSNAKIVCSGTFTGPVTIGKSVQLLGQPGAVIKAPALASMSSPYAIVEITGAGVNATVDGFTIDGVNNGPFFGVLVDKGAQATITDNTIQNVRNTAYPNVQDGVGIGVLSASSTVTPFFFAMVSARGKFPPISPYVPSSGGISTMVAGPMSGAGFSRMTANVSNNTIKAYQKNGIVVDGAGANATIFNNTVTGTPTSAVVQNGIQISGGAIANVTSNTVSNNVYAPQSAAATGIVVTNAPGPASSINVSLNMVTGNDEGIYASGGAQIVSLNQVSASTWVGIELGGVLASGATDPISGAQVTGNNSSGNKGDGIDLYGATGLSVQLNAANNNKCSGIAIAGPSPASTGNQIRTNSMMGNAKNCPYAGAVSDDAQDYNQPINNWAWNLCTTQNVKGLCGF